MTQGGESESIKYYTLISMLHYTMSDNSQTILKHHLHAISKHYPEPTRQLACIGNYYVYSVHMC